MKNTGAPCKKTCRDAPVFILPLKSVTQPSEPGNKPSNYCDDHHQYNKTDQDHRCNDGLRGYAAYDAFLCSCVPCMQHIGDFSAAYTAAAVEEKILARYCEFMAMRQCGGELCSAKCTALSMLLGCLGAGCVGLGIGYVTAFHTLQLMTIFSIGNVGREQMLRIPFVIAYIAASIAILVIFVLAYIFFDLADLAEVPMRCTVSGIFFAVTVSILAEIAAGLTGRFAGASEIMLSRCDASFAICAYLPMRGLVRIPIRKHIVGFGFGFLTAHADPLVPRVVQQFPGAPIMGRQSRYARFLGRSADGAGLQFLAAAVASGLFCDFAGIPAVISAFFLAAF